MKNIPNKLLIEICAEIDDVSKIDLSLVMKKVKRIIPDSR